MRIFGQYVTEELEGASAAGGTVTGVASQEAKTRTFLIGGVFPVGEDGHIKLSYVDAKLSDNIGTPPEKGRLFAVGYDYYFSKRTNIYTVYSHIDNNSGGRYGYAAAYVTPGQGESSSGVSVGLRHQF